MMKTFSAEEIIRKVRTKLDEIAVNESEMMETEEDNKNLDSVIKSCIPGAYRLVNSLADASLLEGLDASSSSLSIDTDLVGRVTLPADFFRCVNVRLSSWKCSASSIISEDSPAYRMQSNQWICGTPNLPVAALVHSKSDRILELYKAASSNDTIISLTYIPVIDDDATKVSISNAVANSFIYFVAALTMATFREEIADDFFKIARSLIGLE